MESASAIAHPPGAALGIFPESRSRMNTSAAAKPANDWKKYRMSFECEIDIAKLPAEQVAQGTANGHRYLRR
jgi:hypothetical protein